MLYVIYWCGMVFAAESFVTRGDWPESYFGYPNEQCRSVCFWLGEAGEDC
jgi:hypothetical protein